MRSAGDDALAEPPQGFALCDGGAAHVGLDGTAVEADPNDGDAAADVERRFGSLRRLYGDDGYARLRRGRVAVVGLGGVGSWAAEALARSGVGALVLIDLDHVAASNINRQVQALGRTLGQGKGDALRERIADIHPGCKVSLVDDFVTPKNWPALLPHAVDALVDACDNVRAKAALAVWGLAARVPVVCVGAAGGKRRPERVEVDDLAAATHDPLLASLRQRLRQHAGAPRTGVIGLRCVFSRESVLAGPSGERAGAPDATPGVPDTAAPPGSAASPGMPLACHGLGSSVMVTATFGLVAAAQTVESLVRSRPSR